MTDCLRRRLRIPSAFLAVGALAAVAALTMAGPALASGTVTCPPGNGTDVQNAINGGGTVTINGTCHGNFTVSTSVTIQGGSPGATLNGDGAGSVLRITAPVTVTIRNLTITNGLTSQGGGISMGGSQTLNLVSSKVTGNVATNIGGGIWVPNNSTLNVTNSTIGANSASSRGGGIGAVQADITLNGASVTGNQAPLGGGGWFALFTEMDATASTFAHNLATLPNVIEGGGGAIWMENSLATLANSRVGWNTSADVGGGIAYWGHLQPTFGLTVTGSTIDHNTAVSSGGGIYSASFAGDATVSLDRTTVSFNRATDGDGGGIANYGKCADTASVVATNSSFGGNLALNGEGGGIYNSNGNPCFPGPSTALITLAKTNVGRVGLTINPNQARYGGGIFNENGDGFSSLSVQAGSSIVHNKASVDGGGIFNCSPASLLIAPSTVLLNSPDNVVDTFCD